MNFTLKRSSSSYQHTVLEDPRGFQHNYTIQLTSLLGCLHSKIISVHHQHLWHPCLGKISHSLQSIVVVINSLVSLHSSFSQRHMLGDICCLCCWSCRMIILCTLRLLIVCIYYTTHHVHHSIISDPPPLYQTNIICLYYIVLVIFWQRRILKWRSTSVIFVFPICIWF